jgi:hypothetical protein
MKKKKIIPFLISLALLGSATFLSCSSQTTTINDPKVNNIVVSNGLIAYYKFEGNTNDSSSGGNNAIDIGGLTYGNGISGKAIIFNGDQTKYAKIPYKETFNVGSKLTLTAWFNKPEESIDMNPLITKGKESEDFTLWGINKGSSLLLNWSKENQFWESPKEDALDLAPKKWNFVAVTYDGTTVKNYLNGVLQYQNNYSHPISDSKEDLFIGISFPGDLEVCKASVDELRVYNRALESTEIVEIFNSNKI